MWDLPFILFTNLGASSVFFTYATITLSRVMRAAYIMYA